MSPKSSTRLLWGQNFSLRHGPQINPTNSSPNILVIGGGVTGLVNAWVLLDRGYRVTIVAKEWASYTKQQRLTSQFAGALWEYPAVCGQHTDNISLTKSKRWCMVAYRVWGTIAANHNLAAASGVQMRSSVFFFPNDIEDDSKQLEKLHEIQRSGIKGVQHYPSLIQRLDIDPSYGVVDAYEHLTPIIDTDRCMAWLTVLVQSKGAELITEKIHGDLLRQFEVAGDPTCYPLRGCLIRIINHGKDFPKVSTAISIAADAARDSEIVFIVPRNDNILLLGGIAQRDEWDLNLSLESPIIQSMRHRYETFLPVLKNARLDPDYPIAQGLRPGRDHNVRVERELRRHGTQNGQTRLRHSRIVHSYGHGGAGWSLSFGCAEEAASLLKVALRGVPATPMAPYSPEIQSSL